MRLPSPTHRAKVAVTVEILVPETDYLHMSERMTGDWTRNHYAMMALKRALKDEDALSGLDESIKPQYEVIRAYRSKHIEGGLPLAGITPERTDFPDRTEAEDHDTVSAESPDPSDSTSEEDVSAAARWDFVVA